jgi:hypothetical protein
MPGQEVISVTRPMFRLAKPPSTRGLAVMTLSGIGGPLYGVSGSGRSLPDRPTQLPAHRDERVDQILHMGYCMEGCRRDPQPLLATRDGRVVDRLDVDAMLCEQQFARAPAEMRVADDHRQDMARRIEDGHVGGLKHSLEALDIASLQGTSLGVRPDMLHGRERACGEVRAKRGR